MKNNTNIIKSNKRKTIIYLLALLCIISNISYYPLLQSTVWARYVVIFCWGMVLLYTISLKQSISLLKSFKLHSYIFVLFILSSVFLFIIGQKMIFANHFFFVVVISYLIFFLSTKAGRDINENDLYMLLFTYSFSIAIISIPLFIFYLRDYDLSSVIYQYSYGKNEMAILIMCAIIIIALLFHPINKLQFIIKLITMLILIINIIYLRCRSAMIGVAICLMFYIYYLNINKYVKYSLIIITLIILTISRTDRIEKFQNDILFAGRNQYDLDNLSSGRIMQINQGIELFNENIFIGIGKNRTIDCFYVSALVNYGLLFVFPIILLALNPICWGIYNYYNSRKSLHPIDICYLTLALSMFTTSCLEELAPFGPGTRCYILWVMFGMMINLKKHSFHKYNKKKIDTQIRILTNKM